MFNDYLVRKEVVLDYKNIDFKQWPYCFFSKGSTHDFGQKMEILYLYVFRQMGLAKLFDVHWGTKQALLDYKNLDITKLPYWDFYTGVNQRFWSKIANFLFVCLFCQNKSRNNVWWSSGEKSNPQSIKCASNFMINKLFFLATNHSACINFCPQSVSQSAMQVVSQSASQSGSQSISQSVSQSVSKKINDFDQKLQISFLLVLGKNRPWGSVQRLSS